MAEFTFSKTLMGSNKRRYRSPAVTLPTRFCSAVHLGRRANVEHAGTRAGVFEHLIQIQDTNRPRIEIGLGVGTLFGLIPFLFGSLLVGALGLILRWYHNR